MNISVIGGSGFIGTRLCHRLQRHARYPFVIVDKNPSLDFPDATVIADVRSTPALRAAIPNGSILVNLAAEHRDDVSPRSLYDDVNVQGTRNLCDVAGERNVNAIIFTSSVAVYGFAPLGTDESGKINPFNDYGRTKFEAEQVLRSWQAQDPARRALTIIRPTVVFGEQNRGNVYNLLRQIASGRFFMVGDGLNRKSIAYVENVAGFIEHAFTFGPGVHVYNYVDKPDSNMNELVATVRKLLGKSGKASLRLPYSLGLLCGMAFDLAARLSGRKFPISAIRVKKFCANSVYGSDVPNSGYVPPVKLTDALQRTVRHEFIDPPSLGHVFFSE